MGHRTGLDAVEKRKISCPFRESNPGRPTRRYIDWYVMVRVTEQLQWRD
jgi:hypothetical protein